MNAVAMDAICIVGPTGNMYCTELYAKFYRTTGVVGSFLGADRLAAESDTTLEVFCNDILCDDHVIAFLGNDRLVKWDLKECTDSYPSTIPSNDILKLMPITNGKNKIRIRHVETNTMVECFLWVWAHTEKIIVVDIDGTITRSDVRGYIETVYMRYYQYCHKGVVEFFHFLCEKMKCKIMFLTSRPIAHYEATKKLLNSLRHVEGGGQNVRATASLQAAWTSTNGRMDLVQNSNISLSLPDGPVFANKDEIAKAAYDELVLRVSEHYKTDSLYGITKLFRRAHGDLSELSTLIGRDGLPQSSTTLRCDCNLPFKLPFIFGFGNRVSDARAYRANGIDPSVIFLIDKGSQVKVWSTCRLSRVLSKRRLTLVLEADSDSVVPARQQMLRGEEGEATVGNGELGLEGHSLHVSLGASGGEFDGANTEAEGDAGADLGSGSDGDGEELGSGGTEDEGVGGQERRRQDEAMAGMLEVYMQAINANTGVGRGERSGSLRTRHGPKVRFSSYTDSLLLQYCIEQKKLLDARDVQADCGGSSSTTTAAAAVPMTLPMYSKQLPPHVVPLTRLQRQTSSGMADSDDDYDDDDDDDGLLGAGMAQPCVAGFCAPGVMAAFTEESPASQTQAQTGYHYQGHASNDVCSEAQTGYHYQGHASNDVCSESIDILSDCNNS